MSREYEREGPSLEEWVPRTQLGKMVKEGQITSIQDIFREGHKVREVEIIDFLVQDLKDEVIDIAMVQKQTDAGENSRFRAVVAVGNGNGWIDLALERRSEYVTLSRRGFVWQNSTFTP
jgi:small subunit ribosomal protein S5